MFVYLLVHDLIMAYSARCAALEGSLAVASGELTELLVLSALTKGHQWWKALGRRRLREVNVAIYGCKLAGEWRQGFQALSALRISSLEGR